MPSIETSIWLALRGRVQSVVLSPVLPISWPNEPFTPPQVNDKPGPYLRVTHLPNQTDRIFIGSNDPHRYQGILQISLFSALDQSPAVPGAVIEQAGQIAAHFPADLRLSHSGVTVRITKRPSIAQGMRDDASSRWHTPVSIFYECYA